MWEWGGCEGLPGAQLPSCRPGNSGLQIGIRCGQLPPSKCSTPGLLGLLLLCLGKRRRKRRVLQCSGAQGGCRDLQSVVLPLESCVFLGECLCLFPCLCWAGADSSSSRDDAGAGGWRGEDQV